MKASKTMKKSARPTVVKAVLPEPARYVPVQERGDRYHYDPVVRAGSWRAGEGAFLAKSRAATGGVTPGQLNHWLLVARTDPDPGIREAMWRAIYEATGGAA